MCLLKVALKVLTHLFCNNFKYNCPGCFLVVHFQQISNQHLKWHVLKFNARYLNFFASKHAKHKMLVEKQTFVFSTFKNFYFCLHFLNYLSKIIF